MIHFHQEFWVMLPSSMNGEDYVGEDRFSDSFAQRAKLLGLYPTFPLRCMELFAARLQHRSMVFSMVLVPTCPRTKHDDLFANVEGEYFFKSVSM